MRRGAGRTIIAGYPWFLDWGRDTLISARGLLAAGMVVRSGGIAGHLRPFLRRTASCPTPSTAKTPPIATPPTRRCGMAWCARKPAQLDKNIYDRPAGRAGPHHRRRASRNRRRLRARHPQRHPHGPGLGPDLESAAFHLDGHQFSRRHAARRLSGGNPGPVDTPVAPARTSWRQACRRTVARSGGSRRRNP